MKTWKAFLEFQNATAYGNSGVPAGSGRTGDLFYITPPVTGGSLIVGPGGANEVLAMKSILPEGEVTTLSAHEPEVAAIMAAAPWAHVYAGDMHCMPFADASFDYLFCSNVMEHAASPIVALLECRRVLRDGAKAHFILPSFDGSEGGVGPFHWFCMDERHWVELLRKVGLHIQDVQIERGTADANTGYYMHFRVEAGSLPQPYDRLMQRVKELRAQ